VVPARTGVWIGVLAISMSFAAITSAMIARAGGALDWERFQLPPILYANTLLLLLSSWTIEAARSRLPAGERSHAIGGTAVPWLALTLTLGLMFIAGQVLAWRALAAQGLFLATSPSSSFFYLFTALHALHLLGGVMALGYALYRLRTTVGPAAGDALGAAALYWHFMTCLWLYLLLLLTIRI
jgi:cytochrome c oxidase subunit 3